MHPVLTINGGSSSLRVALFEARPALRRLFNGEFARIGLPTATLTVTNGSTGLREVRKINAPDHASCIPEVLGILARAGHGGDLAAIGHRIVHGGPHRSGPAIVDAPLLAELRRLVPFAPGHLPMELGLIGSFAGRFPDVPQVACFDTTFHDTLPPVARLLAIPRRYQALGVRRYGFHGLSYSSLMEELARLGDPAALHGAVVLAHLGNGASLAAVRDGTCIDTSMGFTPAAGLPMGTRAGDLDPGLMGFLALTEGMTPSDFDRMVHHESGLLGVSETASDMRDLLELETTDIRAAEAVSLFCQQARKWIGAYAAALGGLDTLVFAGGIGENCPTIRARICDGLGFLGIELNQTRNAANATVISQDAGRVPVRVLHSDEERMIALAACRLVPGSGSGDGKPTAG